MMVKPGIGRAELLAVTRNIEFSSSMRPTLPLDQSIIEKAMHLALCRIKGSF